MSEEQTMLPDKIEKQEVQIKETSLIIQKEADQFIERFKKIEVIDDDSVTSAERLRKDVKRKMKDLKEDRLSLTKNLDDTKKKIMAKYKPIQDKLDEAHEILKGKIKVYMEAREAKEQKEREFQAKVEKVRLKIAAEEQKRVADAAKKAEEERVAKLREAAQATVAGDEKEAAKKAEEAERARLQALALEDQKKAQEAAVAKPIIEIAPPPKVDKRTIKKHLAWKVVNAEAVPRFVMSIDNKKVNEYGFANGKDKAVLPGIEFFYE